MQEIAKAKNITVRQLCENIAEMTNVQKCELLKDYYVNKYGYKFKAHIDTLLQPEVAEDQEIVVINQSCSTLQIFHMLRTGISFPIFTYTVESGVTKLIRSRVQRVIHKSN